MPVRCPVFHHVRPLNTKTFTYLACLQADDFAGFEDEGGEGRSEGQLPDVTCQRCYSLKHAGCEPD